ncbi:MAG: NADH:flavin oxidoreductase [Planctomycetes bacterium]|nr:NADH:flavin oxidoreductase [Planctomycetota bacterium]
MTSWLSPSKLKTFEEFAAQWAVAAPGQGCVAVPEFGNGPLAQPISVEGRLLPNRFAMHPMEGWDATENGEPSEFTMRRWRHFGRSGAALIWGGEAYAVVPEGRANPRQLCRHPQADNAGTLALLRAQVLAGRVEANCGDEPFLLGLQLTHSGRFAVPQIGKPRPRPAQRHPLLEQRYPTHANAELISDAELDDLILAYAATAKLAWNAGFDFVDLKACHGYLVHDLLGAHDRAGCYGGSFANRSRFLRMLVESVRSECMGLGIGVRLSAFDRVPHETDPTTRLGHPMNHGTPWRHSFGVDQKQPSKADFSEPVELVRNLERMDVRLWNVSAGSPYWCPHAQRPAVFPPSDGYQPPHDPLQDVAALFAAAAAVRRAAPGLTVVSTGATYLQEWLPHVVEAQIASGNCDFVGLGRMLLSDPDYPRRYLREGRTERRLLCRTFSECTTAPREGRISGCYPLDPLYREQKKAP